MTIIWIACVCFAMYLGYVLFGDFLLPYIERKRMQQIGRYLIWEDVREKISDGHGVIIIDARKGNRCYWCLELKYFADNIPESSYMTNPPEDFYLDYEEKYPNTTFHIISIKLK